MIPFAQIWWTDSETGEEKEISDLLTWTSKRAAQIKSNSLQLTVKNIAPDSQYAEFFDAGGKLKFSIDDSIKAYLKDVPIDTAVSSHLLMSATIIKVEPRFGEQGREIILHGSDRTFLLLAQYAVGNYSGTAPEIIKQIIKLWTGKGDGSYPIGTDTYVASTKSGGGAFPTKDYTVVYKALYEVVSELSQLDYTEDIRPFIFWVDEDDELHWVYPSQTADDTIDETVEPLYNIDITKQEKDEVNMIIYHCGKDKNDNTISWYKFNLNTTASKLKVVYQDWSKITKEMQAPGATFDWTGSTNDQVRTEANRRASAKCDDYFARKGLIWKGKITMKGTRTFTTGQLVEVTSFSCGFASQKLRIMDTIHTLSGARGWITTLQVEEDPLEMPG